MYLISACLAGIDCRYNGKSNRDERIIELIKSEKAILVCPEQLGGLSTPRPPSEIVKSNGHTRVISKDGDDLSQEFLKGAEETLKIAKMMKIKKAILKSRSPSCGYGKIYDGSFSKKIVDGNGLTADILEKNGLEIYTEESLKDL